MTLPPPDAAIWISWERHRRTRELSRDLGLRLFEMHAHLPRALKYLPLLWSTARVLLRERPRVLFIQCPSFVLGLWAVAWKPLLGYTLVADLHTEAVEPFITDFPGYRALLALVRRGADVCLVSNHALKERVDREGGRAFVLPDKLPALGDAPPRVAGERPLVVFICTFAKDEPYAEVIEAARRLGDGITLRITGNPGRFVPDPPLPAHVQLTGFLPDAEYDALLRDADVVVDLTSADNCLVCGAYEAVALGKPLVTSDTRALRAHFSRGTIYARHDAASLADAIRTAVAARVDLAAEMRQLKRLLAGEWQERRAALQQALRLERA